MDAEVILPDHLHLLWSLPPADADYATRIRLVNTTFTKDVRPLSGEPSSHASRARKGERAILQRRYWEHTIGDERDYAVHVDYIHYNPVRHGLVAWAGDWPHSTFHDWLARGAYDASWGVAEPPALQGRTWRE